MAIDETLSSSTNSGTVSVRDSDFYITGTWVGTLDLEANVGGSWRISQSFTANDAGRLAFASLTEVRFNFTRTSGSAVVYVGDDALNRRN